MPETNSNTKLPHISTLDYFHRAPNLKPRAAVSSELPTKWPIPTTSCSIELSQASCIKYARYTMPTSSTSMLARDAGSHLAHDQAVTCGMQARRTADAVALMHQLSTFCDRKRYLAIDEDGQQQEWTDRGAKPGWLHSRRQQIQHPTPRSLVRPIGAYE